MSSLAPPNSTTGSDEYQDEYLRYQFSWRPVGILSSLPSFYDTFANPVLPQTNSSGPNQSLPYDNDGSAYYHHALAGVDVEAGFPSPYGIFASQGWEDPSMGPFLPFSFGQPSAPICPQLLTPPYAMTSLPLSLPEDVAKAGEKTTIPLLCILCPKKPTFSDVSHLLTHISSKSHLSSQFKASYHAKKEPEARHTLDQYDQWYQQNDIEGLMASRLSAKEQKDQNKPQKRPRAATIVKQSRQSTVDTEDIKAEPDDELFDHYAPDPFHWDMSSGRPSMHYPDPRGISMDDHYETPAKRPRRHVYPLPDSPQSTSTYVKYETSRSATETTDPSEVADNPDGENKELKLKGVEWPGMGGFDAATPAQQRKRNQRKHVSVLEQMKLASKAVEQNEYIWDETMQEIQKTRNIYDSPSIDGSPTSKDNEEGSGRKRRGRRPASAKAGATNVRQTRATTRAVKGTKRGAAGTKRKTVKTEASPEPMAPSLRKRGRGAAASGNGGDVFQESRRQSPMNSGNHLAGQRMDLPFRPRAALQPLSTNAPLASPTPMSYKPDTNSTAFPFFNKENDIMPFQLRQPNNMQGFFSHQRHAMQPTGFNPLCVQPQDNFSYLYSGSSYENPGPTDTAFQSFNGMNFDMNASQHFSPAPPQDPHDTNEFDI